MSKTAAITGATGFVGKHLVRALLDRGFRVRALTRRPQPTGGDVEWIEGDLADEAALRDLLSGADIVFHLAGLIKARRRHEFGRINSGSVTTLLEIIHDQPTPNRPHFILLSSLAARERHLSTYAESKRRGEELLIAGAGDMPWTILRPPGIYGPEDLETLKIFKAIAARIAPIPGDAANRASWIYAPDLVQAMIAVAGNEACFSQILDVDDGAANGYSVAELYDTAAKILDIRPYQFIIPRYALSGGAHINVLFSTLFGYTPMVTPEKINELCFPDWICRGPHVMRMTPWRPETDLEAGLKNTLEWYKKNNLI